MAWGVGMQWALSKGGLLGHLRSRAHSGTLRGGSGPGRVVGTPVSLQRDPRPRWGPGGLQGRGVTCGG